MIDRLLQRIPVEARASFRRLMMWTVVAAVTMVTLTIAFLAWVDALNTVTVVATSIGVFLSVMLGSGLMAMGFLSANSGHDDWAADFAEATPSGAAEAEGKEKAATPPDVAALPLG